MFERAFILFAFLLVFDTFGQEKESNYYLVCPKFTSSGSTFDISLTITNTYPKADSFDLWIVPDNAVSLNKAEYKSVYESTKLNLLNKDVEDYSDASLINVNLKDSLRKGVVFQVVMNFKSELSNSSRIKFKGVFKEGDSVLAYLKSSKNIDDENFISANVDFYKPQKVADKDVLFSDDSYVNIDIDKKFKNNLLVEFWLKANDAGTDFLKIYRDNIPQPDFILSTNKFQMLTISSNAQSQTFLKPYFTGKKSWYHIVILTSKKDRQIYFYCNGTLVAKNNLPDFFEPDNVNLTFGTTATGKSFLIDQLRIEDFNNTVGFSFSNSHSTVFSSDSSSLVAQYSFDSYDELNTENENVKVETSNLRFMKSDAPLFARTPELNINILGDSYELEWNGGDYKRAATYSLEKSSDGKPYTSVFTIQAENTEEKTYSFIDAVDQSSEIVYYRIKQLNNDGSVIYSDLVKVGQGEEPPFTLGQNYPNPFNPKTSIDIELLEDSEIEITIYNLEGKEIVKLFKGFLSKGVHKFFFDAEGLPSGIYLYKVAAPNFTQTKKMILTK
jgi:Secretion system C-terminal sorting domain/Concanavalin A-like lectin/glucanases superfamily